MAFQILNDLNDWEGDDHNKLAAGGDILGGRPTVLWALALEGLAASEAGRAAGARRTRLPTPDCPTPASPASAQLYEEAGVFEKASRLIEKHQERAEKIADEIEPEELRALLYYLIDSVLDHARADPPPCSSIDRVEQN